MEKTIAELRADKAELEARIAEAKRKDKRGKAHESLKAWHKRNTLVMTAAESALVDDVVATLNPNPLLGDARP